MTEDRLMKPAAVAEWLQTRVETLARWRMDTRKTGQLVGPKWQPICSRIFYRASDVQAWLDAQQEEVA